MTEDEKRVVLQAKNGSREALNTLVVRYWQSIYLLLLHKLQNEDDAKEMTQETFLKAFRSLPRYQVLESSFKAYLARIAFNLVNDHWRKKGRMFEEVNISDHEAVLFDPQDQPEAYAVKSEQREQLIMLLGKLPEEQRQTLELRIIMELSIKETADYMGKTEAAVKMLQQRGLKNLRNLWQKHMSGNQGGEVHDR